ncbi:ABC transporter permease [Mucilaginibacter sp. dw_454]|uniref:ABC transporter permease n=1 Tax=Mucilaginibacter sp. dw_454 TaxID=2720079 RepID=UPI001BD4E07B|nr:ABC transporter permease [Mucilaginibacter sp. dw_454]
MIKNYLRSAWRNLKRHKFISGINVLGLTVGIACCLIILTYIIKELSYDTYNANAKDIYRVTRIFKANDGSVSLHLSAVAPPYAHLLKNEFPDIKKVTQIYPIGGVTLRYKEKLLNEKNAYMADENFFDFFTSNILKGDAKTALNEPYSVVITEELARRYFGNEDPINKQLLFDNQLNFKVTGVFKDLPANSQFHPEILMSFSTLNDEKVFGKKALTNWGNNSFYTYLLFPPNYNVAHIAAQLPAFIDKVMPGGPNNHPSKYTELTLQKFLDIHLKSHLDSELEDNGDIKRVYIFSAIALFILLIACINYMNLSTARSTLRAKEIGVRKVIGAQKKEIITQFLSESVLIAYASLMLAVLATWLALPAINHIADLGLSFGSLLQPDIILAIALLPLAVGLLSGVYPAIFMSSFNPAKVLKGLFKAGSGSLSFRKVLVVTQFSISIILIVATTVVLQQLKYIQNKSLGLSKDQVVALGNGIPAETFDAFRTDLLRDPSIREVARSSRFPSDRLLDDQSMSVMENGKLQPVQADVKYVNTDYGFVPTYGIKMAAGRNFSRDFGTDSNNYIINVAAAKMIGWKTPNAAIGHDVKYGDISGKIIGVTNDFHFESLHQDIVPMIMRMPAFGKENFSKVGIKLAGSHASAALKTIEQTWRKYQANTPFSYYFLDERFQKLYTAEQQQGTLFTIFSFIAIFIACLGLFGLSAFTISQRVKEIGVRKVLGASVPQIVIELSKDFLKLVIVASVIALPIAWYAMHKWLLDFASRISISVWVLVMAGTASLVIAFITISFQSIKAALANPVKSLRSE